MSRYGLQTLLPMEESKKTHRTSFDRSCSWKVSRLSPQSRTSSWQIDRSGTQGASESRTSDSRPFMPCSKPALFSFDSISTSRRTPCPSRSKACTSCASMKPDFRIFSVKARTERNTPSTSSTPLSVSKEDGSWAWVSRWCTGEPVMCATVCRIFAIICTVPSIRSTGITIMISTVRVKPNEVISITHMKKQIITMSSTASSCLDSVKSTSSFGLGTSRHQGSTSGCGDDSAQTSMCWTTMFCCLCGSSPDTMSWPGIETCLPPISGVGSKPSSRKG
mmetsp:Transcript_25823/g.60320  ORF Transcript_25823/g.60320 Transcript_25823/m.60320 type:complete len:277 (-) Transcript_25823:413-1243(-)